jgi:hypothetical protein
MISYFPDESESIALFRFTRKYNSSLGEIWTDDIIMKGKLTEYKKITRIFIASIQSQNTNTRQLFLALHTNPLSHKLQWVSSRQFLWDSSLKRLLLIDDTIKNNTSYLLSVYSYLTPDQDMYVVIWKPIKNDDWCVHGSNFYCDKL